MSWQIYMLHKICWRDDTSILFNIGLILSIPVNIHITNEKYSLPGNSTISSRKTVQFI